MADEGEGEQPKCPSCGEDVEADWVKCPMCNTNISASAPEAPRPETMSPGPTPPPPVEKEVPTEAGPPGPPKETPKPAPSPDLTLAPPPKMAGKEDPGLEADLMKADEARRISEAAVAKSKAEAEIADLEAQLEEKDSIIEELQETIASQSEELDALEKKSYELDMREQKALARFKEIEEKEKKAKNLEAELNKLDAEKKTVEAEKDMVKKQATSLTDIENKIAEQKKKLEQWEGHLLGKEAELDEGKQQLDTMIEQYGDKLTSLKGREDKIAADELSVQEMGAKLEIEKRDLVDQKGIIEKEKADISDRSNKLFEKIQRAEERTKEMDKRENVIEMGERKNERWEEDLRHTEIHLLSIQEEMDNCVYCSVKDRFMTVDKLLAEAQAVGADVDLAEEEVKRAKMLLDEGEFEKAVERAKNAIRIAGQAKKQYYSYGVKYTIKAVEKIIMSIKELGVSTEEPENLLKDAKEALSEEDFERAEDYAKMAERIVLHMEEKAEDISATVRRLEGMIGQAKAEGRDASLATDLMNEAKEEAKRGEYGPSLDTLREAEEALIEQQVSSVQAGLNEDETPEPGPPAEEPSYVEEEQTYQEPVQEETYYQPQQEVAPYPQQPEPTPQSPAGSRFQCPYCSNVFEVRAENRPVTATCPYCSQKVLIN